MILNSFKGFIEITPHSLRNLKSGQLSSKVVSLIEYFIQDLIANTSGKSSEEEVKTVLKSFNPRFQEIKRQIQDEIPDKNGNMRFIPAEYIEMIYIITYYLYDNYGITQKVIASLFGFDEKIYKDRGGITPVNDCKATKLKYSFRLLIDDDKDFLETIIPFLGKVSAQISNSYSVCLCNNISIITNLEYNNARINHKGFQSKQMYYNIKEAEDMIQWVFNDNFAVDVIKIKNSILNLIDTENKELTEEIFVKMMEWGIDIGQENLRRPELENFNYSYTLFKECIKKRDWFQEARDDLVYKHADIFMLSVEEINSGKEINRQEFCDKEVARLNREIDIYLDYFIDLIDFSTLDVTILPLLSYLVEQYNEELYVTPANDLFLNPVSFCAKYFIHKFFSTNGVSEDSYTTFKTYLEGKFLRDFASRFKSVDCLAFMNNEEIYSKVTLEEKFSDLKTNLYNAKEKRGIPNRALIYIDLEDFPFKDLDIEKLIEADENFYLVVKSLDKRNLPLEESILEVNDNKYYIYTDRRVNNATKN